MKTLLVLAFTPELSETVRAAVSPEHYRVLYRAGLEEAEPFLAHGLVEACILELQLDNVQAIWILEGLRRRAPKCPLIIVASASQAEWEEEAYLRGASHVLHKPVRPRMLSTVLERLLQAPAPPPNPVPAALPPASPPEAATSSSSFDTALLAGGVNVMREFSRILNHSLDTQGMFNQFLQLVRDMLSVNRAAIFIRRPPAVGPAAEVETRRLRSAAAIGLSSALLQHFELSLEAGIGGNVFRLARILRRNSVDARADLETQKEFEILGGQVAVPIMDREAVIGVAVLDGRITGEALSNSELDLVFRLLEQVGLALKNIWLHEQLAANHRVMADILRELASACVVVSSDLGILHANKTARRYFTRGERKGDEFEFSDLPEALAARVYQVLKSGAAIANFKYEPADSPGTLYNVSVVPFQAQHTGAPASALLMAEDLTRTEQLRRLEIEAANLRLIRNMADRLTHEIGNAMVPLSTHQQLLADKWRDAEFRASLDSALADGVKRVTRLINQMRFLARDSLAAQDDFPLAPLLEEAYQEACKYQPAKASQLRYDAPNRPIMLKGDRAALKHAFAEVMLNALQANPSEPRVGIRLGSESNGDRQAALEIEVHDNGTGFSTESAANAMKPFYTTRNVGLGLGLTVTNKIIETHRGRLQIPTPVSGEAGVIRIWLPLEAAAPERSTAA